MTFHRTLALLGATLILLHSRSLSAQTPPIVPGPTFDQPTLNRPVSGGSWRQILNSGLGPVQSYLEQAKSWLNPATFDRTLKQLETLLGSSVNQVVGAIGLPDPQQVLQQVFGGQTDQPTQQADGGINPIAWNRGGDILTILQTGQLQVQRILDQKNQQAYLQELERLAALVSSSNQTATTTQQTITATVQQANQASQLTAQSQQQANQAQQRVSTQDALKDLNLTAADLSTQLGLQTAVLAGMNQAQGTQINLQTAQLQAEVASVAHSQQINLNTAVAAQQLTSLNELNQGQERLRLLQNQATAAQLMESGQTGFRFMR